MASEWCAGGEAAVWVRLSCGREWSAAACRADTIGAAEFMYAAEAVSCEVCASSGCAQAKTVVVVCLWWCFFDKHLASGVRAHHTTCSSLAGQPRARTHRLDVSYRSRMCLHCLRFTDRRTCTFQIVTPTSSIVHAALRGH
jgi:hypothetical protein